MGRTVTQNELLKPCIHRFLYLLRSGIFLLALMLVACTARPQMPIQRGVQLPMMVPSNVIVGQSIPVTIGPSAEPDGTMVMLIALDSFGPRTYSATLSGGSVRFIIPGEDTQRAGIVLLMARTPNGYGTASIVLQAGPAIAPLTLHVGPHTVPADGISLGMVVAIPNDTYGNAISSGDPVELRFQNPTGTIVTRDVAAQNGIAWIRMPGGTQAGRMLVVGRAGTAHGPEADLSLTAGWPISFTLMADPATLTAWGTAWKDAMLKAIDGQIYFLFLAPFAYRYWWAEDQAIVEGMEREVAQLGGEFQTQFSVFSQALNRKDLDAAEEAGNKLLDMYQAEHRSIPDDVLLAVRRQQGEDRETWMQRLMQTAVKESAVAEQINPKVNKGRFLAVSFITTLLAGYLMQGSLNGRQILGDGSAPFGIDLTHWNLFAGTTPGDGAHAIIVKSLLMINAIWLAGLGYKAAWDGGKIVVSKVAKLFTGSSTIPAETEFAIDPAAQEEQAIASEVAAAAVTAPVPAPANGTAEADQALWARFQGSIKAIGAFFGIGKSQEARALQQAQVSRAVAEACSELVAAEAKARPRTTASTANN